MGDDQGSRPSSREQAAVLAEVRRDIDACRAAHDQLDALIEGLTDDQARLASELPGWSVGHVLTHIARNGDSVVHLTEAVGRGEVADQYPGGPSQRTGDIEAGAGRPAAELVADVRAVHRRIHDAWDRLDDARWLDGVVRTASVREMPASYLPTMRLREVVVHTSDLGLPGATWQAWPDPFVAAELPRLAAMLVERDPDAARALVAQLMGRRAGPLSVPSVMW